jgi:hypothetical protein
MTLAIRLAPLTCRSVGAAAAARGYAVSTVGFELEQVRQYIREQDAADGSGQFCCCNVRGAARRAGVSSPSDYSWLPSVAESMRRGASNRRHLATSRNESSPGGIPRSRKPRVLFHKGKGNDLPGVQGTLWAAYNGIAEMVDHGANKRSPSQHLDYIWFGGGYGVKARGVHGGEAPNGHRVEGGLIACGGVGRRRRAYRVPDAGTRNHMREATRRLRPRGPPREDLEGEAWPRRVDGRARQIARTRTPPEASGD